MKNNLSKYACLYATAERMNKEEEDFRNPFFRDIDKIIYSLSYLRYSDKTQVFSFEPHAHVIKRSMHVQYVSKIARTIGRELGLNEDLIEAASLAHDVGHAPFGHQGEKILNKLSLKHNMGFFSHNVHSVRVLNSIENYGKGLNLTYQVLDAVLCHNGEAILQKYEPFKKSIDEFFNDYRKCYIEKKNLVPGTLEGCVVRISDVISYVGKDLEDAIRLKCLKKESIPKSITSVLGDSNKKIINTLINDIINNSRDNNYIMLSDDVYLALNELIKFNYLNIYNNSYSARYEKELESNFENLFDHYLLAIENNDDNINIIKSYLNNMCDEYKKNKPEQIVIDYIAGMTDTYLKEEVKKIG